jgi:GDP-mannose transporter
MSGQRRESPEDGASRGEHQSGPAADDILEVKKAIAQGVSLEGISKSPVPPVLSYCAASIMMTVVNKVRVEQIPEMLMVDRIMISAVCCVWEWFLNELSPSFYPVRRLRGVCDVLESRRINIISGF